MKKSKSPSYRLFSLTALTLVMAYLPNSFAGVRDSGGGDDYTLDFVKVATQTVFPWLVENGAKLSPSVNANAFLMAINPRDIESKDRVFESCNTGNDGREVVACYQSTTGKVFLSRRLYQIDSDSPSKVGLVAHEIFRKMGIEGDGYEVTKQMSLARDDLVIEATTVELAGLCHIPGSAYGDAFVAHTTAMLDAMLLQTSGGVANDLSGKGNPACQVAQANYYKETNNANATFTALKSYDDGAMVGNVTPDGRNCPNNGQIGFVVYHCTMRVQ